MAKKIFQIASFCFLSAVLAVSVANAGGLSDAFKNPAEGGSDVQKAANAANYDITKESVTPFFAKMISVGLSILGIVFTLLMIYGGFLWMSDQGNEEQVEKAKKLITAAFIGLVIVVSSYAITWTITNLFVKKTLQNTEAQ